jgi:hypothetical protein
VDENRLLGHAGFCRKKAQREINNACIWSSIALESLETSLKDSSFLERQRYEVPSAKPRKVVKRSRDEVEEVIKAAAGMHLHRAVFVYLVAHVEACLTELLRAVLIEDPRRIKCRVDGIKHMKSVEVDTAIDCVSHSSLIEEIVGSELVNVFYANPKAQLTYLEKVLGIGLDDATKSTWREIKASRDIIVHNSGVINETYMLKAETRARGAVGDDLVVDKVYFEESASAMKSLVGRICSKFQADIRKNKRNAPNEADGAAAAS